ncbi:hypothetical protein PIB30_077172, partial [Stylosanthes scabra]|nr:hypothetical protein [Stylosanthes scabra]
MMAPAGLGAAAIEKRDKRSRVSEFEGRKTESWEDAMRRRKGLHRHVIAELHHHRRRRCNTPIFM